MAMNDAWRRPPLCERKPSSTAHGCAKVARGCGKFRGRDGSRHGRYHRLPYRVHHVSRISAAAVVGNAKCMLEAARIRALESTGV